MKVTECNSPNFTARNPEIRYADDLARKVNKLFPRMSSSLIQTSKNYKDEMDVAERIYLRIADCRYDRRMKIRSQTTFAECANMIMDSVRDFKVGNCGESAYLSIIMAKLNGILNCSIVDLYSKEKFRDIDLDHSVLFVQGKKPYIIDAWLGFADYVPKAIERYNKEYRHCFSFESPKFVKCTFRDAYSDMLEFLHKQPTKEDLEILKQKHQEVFIDKSV